ncbi:S8 family serine peptidase [Neobacillus mesonae]|uniref:S8 family serine peptidase n=1 Tax=Neobacillus mesonae TaxID=1193713 RepID=UPI00082D2101|nr:S8 family serine peptidase [Neobacillus mesonae]
MKFKRSLPLLLILLMVFSSAAQAAVPKAAQSKSSQITQLKHQLSKSIKGKDVEKNYKKTDKVRVIVEVDGEPAITYATKQGKKYSELAKSVKDKLENNLINAQQNVKNQIAQKAINMKFKQHFTTTFNGFSGEVEYGRIPAIKSIVGVSKVTIAHEYQRPEIKPDMKYSKEIVEAQKAWEDYGYKGEGMVVGIIDTGIDPSHKDMILTDKSKAALTEGKVNTLKNEKGLPGKFYTEKVPYGYNYYDENEQILDLGPDASMHGMHVAGTVGANGDEEKGGIKGVAPEAQFLALKVFGNDPEMPSTWSDIIIKAIDDSIKLGADVDNLSLGSTSAFVQADDPEQMAVQRAVDNGVLMSISAGNSNHFGDGYFNPLGSNPDYGVVGAPGIATNSLQVASIENNYMDLDAITYSFDGTEAGKAPFLSASNADPLKQKQKSFEVLAAGIGEPADFEGKDFKGKYALIQRGVIGFVDKTLNAQKKGAVGVIIYNNADGFVNMASDPAITIPQLFMLKTDGDQLKAKLDAGAKVTIDFKGDKVTAQNPTAGKMSDFTSWGVTPNLDFKPEITAPGGNIYSTLNNNQYGVMSGTSMAAPHVSSGASLVLERVKKDFADLKGAARVSIAKNLLMNTSKVVADKGTYNSYYNLGNPYSPRRQGAGVMQLHAALSTPIVVTDSKTNEAKVALKEIKDNKATFTLNVRNFSNQEVTYVVDGNVQTDLAFEDEETGLVIDEMEAQGIYKNGTISDSKPWTGEYPISFSQKEITVRANESTTIGVTVDLTDTVDWGNNDQDLSLEDIFKNGYFVEGFVTLTDINDKYPVVSVPYVGFNGDWNKPPILDKDIYDGNDAESFYAWTGMLTNAGVDEDGYDNYDYLGYNPADESFKTKQIAISPNSDGVQDNALPILTFLRNAKSVEYKIVDKDGNVLRKLKSETNVLKNFNDGGRGLQYYINPANAWDGKIKNKLAADGTYYYEIDATIDYPGKAPQVKKFPVIVDTVAPRVTARLDGKKLSISSTDGDGSGVAFYDILVSGKSIFAGKEAPLAGGPQEFTFDDTPVGLVEVVAYDYAGNTSKVEVRGGTDNTIPYVHVTSIGAANVYASHDLPVAGYVTDQSKLKSLSLKVEPANEADQKYYTQKEVKFTWNAAKAQYEFETAVSVKNDGVYNIRITGADDAGNKIDYLVRDLMVDTTAPQIKVNKVIPSKVKTSTVELDVTVSDNYDEIHYYVDGSEEFTKDFAEPYAMRSLSKQVKTTLELELGNNTFTLELVDLAGNKTTKEIKVYRGDFYKVNYYNGKEVVKTDEVIKGLKTTAPEKLKKSGYTFIGWYKDAKLTSKFDFNQPITADTNVYAKFVKNLAAPAKVKAASADYNKLTVSWAKVTGASSYDVYRATSKTGKYTKAATVKGTSYSNSGLTTGTTYYYKVVANGTVDGVKLASPYSSVVSGKPALKTPTGVKAAKASSTSVKVNWSKVNGASGYQVYRATSKAGKYSAVKTVTSGKTVSFTNTKLAKGKTYYYKVRAYKTVSSKKVYSSYSAVVSKGLK